MKGVCQICGNTTFLNKYHGGNIILKICPRCKKAITMSKNQLYNSKSPIKLKCYKCGKVWVYGGNNKLYACCPQCHRQVKIMRAIYNAT